MRKAWTINQLLWASFLITGLPLWFTSYDNLSLRSIMWVLMALLALVTGLYTGQTKTPVLRATATATGGFVMAYLLKMVQDLVRDSTTHNLFPIELVLIALVGFFGSLFGGALGWAARKIIAKRAHPRT